ncbi:structural protein [Sulfolobus polyhedral virus 3]|nr:structural protein [Sulfolobus polyhedral virus 3]
MTNVLTTDPLSALNISNPSRPHYQPLNLEPGAILTAKALTLAANGTSATTDNVFLKIQVVDYSS